jgi:hypothetical protein
MRLQSSRRVLLVIPVVLLLAGCQKGGLSIPVDEVPQEACDVGSSWTLPMPPTESAVDCDFAGATAIFPDGEEVRVPSRGGTRGVSGDEDERAYSIANLGSLGIVATMTEPGGDETTWLGHAAAVDATIEHYGRDPNYPEVWRD